MSAQRSPLLIIFAVLAAACAGDPEGSGNAAADASAGIVIANVGFSTPESVLHNPVADIYLVSNISGSPIDEDGDGFISRHGSPGVSREAARWHRLHPLFPGRLTDGAN